MTATPTETGMKNTSRKRILLAEDYHANIVVAHALLQTLGFDVIVAKNGQEALDKLAEEAFNLVLMDVQMPEMDGYTATRIIREEQAANKLPQVKIIGMTAHSFMEDRQRCLDAGMDDYLAKPFEPAQLESIIHKYLV